VAFHTTKTAATKKEIEGAVSTWHALELGADQIVHGLGELMWVLAPEEELMRKGYSAEKHAKRDFGALVNVVHLLPPGHPKVAGKVQSLFAYLIDHNVAIESMLNVSFRTALPDDVLALFDESGMRDYQENFTSTPAIDVDNLQGFTKRLLEIEYAFWKAGGLLTLGSEAGQGLIAGYTNLRSIELLTMAGIPPLAAIQIATENGARAMNISDDRGTIQVGKRADLIVVKGDPSKQITAIYDIETVFKKGVGYDAKTLKDSVKGMVRGPE
jgi:hypothetical protein